MADFKTGLFVWSLLLVVGQLLIYGGTDTSFLSETFDTLSLGDDSSSALTWLFNAVTFPLDIVIGLVKLCSLTGTGLYDAGTGGIAVALIMGAPACVGLVWMLIDLIAAVTLAIGNLIPFT